VASPKKSALYRLRWLLLAPIPLVWCAVAHNGFLAFLEDKVVDWRFRYRGPIDSPVNVVYVNVDSLSLSEIGGWPWSREYFATVGRTLIEHAGVKAIGMDLVFSDIGMAESADLNRLIAGNRDFGAFLWKTPSVVVAASFVALDFKDENNKQKIREFPDVSRPDLPPLHQLEPPELPSFLIAAGQPPRTPPGVALIDTVDGGTRWVRLFAPSAARTYYTMAVELARIYYGVDRDNIRVSQDYMDLARDDGSIAAHIPLVGRQMLEINWFSQWLNAACNPHVSFSTVYSYCLQLKSDDPVGRKSAEEFFAQFKDAVVLIGPTDVLMHDLSPTPLDDGDVPRVSVHGNLFKTIVTGKYLVRLPEAGAYALIFALSYLVCLLSVAGGGRAVFAKVMAVLSTAVYVAAAFQLFKTSNVIIPVVAPLCSAFSTSFAGLVWQIVEEEKQKGRIKGMFGAYVSPALVSRMVDSGEEPKLGGVEEDITAYFSDIQSFSSFSEKLSPPKLVELMNEYLTACTDIVQAEGGTLDKYIGDAVVAMYGAPLALPDHAHRASVAALRVQRRSAELREKWIREGDRWPEIVHRLQTRIGLNSGPAVVGNMGSHTRFNYTMMGDNVNIAARMESGAKKWGVYTMCTEATRLGCEKAAAGRVFFRALGRIVVKGRTLPLPIFEMVALAEDVTDANRECIALFEQGILKYCERDWDGALALFRRSEPLEVNGPGRAPGTHDNPSLVYIEITRGYRAKPPPAEWDGVFEMTEK
jgi:adenylate cyclase